MNDNDSGLNFNPGKNELDNLPLKRDFYLKQVTTTTHTKLIPKISTWKEFHKQGVKHRDCVPIGPNSEYAFPTIEGPGMITNIWFTATPMIKVSKKVLKSGEPYDADKIRLSELSSIAKMALKVVKYKKFPNLLNKVKLQIYFDDNEVPFVNVPLGKFFGVGFGYYKHFMSRYIGMTAGGYISQFRMPFKKRAVVKLVNTSDKMAVQAFYGAVTYAEFDNDERLKDMYYFHAVYNEEHPTTEGKPYLILDTLNNNNKD
ncbi:MAG: DUF2961 domain-containing protein, partial [Promethearchaeota archaeon]